VLVPSGDPNLSQRVRPDGTLAYENFDHSYGHVLEGAAVVPGDPLQVLRGLARQVAARGVKRVTGGVAVRGGPFAEGAREGGTGVVISPVSLNDNVIDVIVQPGAAPGAPASLRVSPELPEYAVFEGRVTTVAADGEASIAFEAREEAERQVVRATGTIPMGPARPFPYAVPVPSRFAEVALVRALADAGVACGAERLAGAPDLLPANVVAEHVSPPLREDVKVTLKVSQNLHAGMMPHVLGAGQDDAASAGFARIRAFLEQAGLDVSAAAQSDGEGGSAWFTPSFMVRFLAYMAEQKEGPAFRDALPVLGRDGTLASTLTRSPAAGRLRAKTGTNVGGDLLNQQYMVRGKGLAGYLDAADGSRLVVVAFVNNVPAGGDLEGVTAVGDALAEIAAAAYDAR
jgi:D-alanyl-D-alanine carboxypeptidase/D-alanyl-D-alanine-endopeptidase (penicillin-binding protein 4)